jgi:hypothetical protein
VTKSHDEATRGAKLRRLERAIILTIVVVVIAVPLACGFLQFFLDQFKFAPG